MSYAYMLELTPDDNGTFLVTCPDLPEVTSYGESEDEAVSNGRRAIEESLAARLSRFEDIPSPDCKPGPRCIQAPLRLQPKIALMQAMIRQHLSRADLVRRLSWNRNSVDRLFDPDHNSRLDQFEAAFQAIGAVPAFITNEAKNAAA